MGRLGSPPPGYTTQFPTAQENLSTAEMVLRWGEAATQRLLLRAGVPHRHWRHYMGRGKAPRALRKRITCKAPDGAADAPGRRAMVLLRGRLKAILPAYGTPRWEQRQAKRTRERIAATGTWGMEEQDAQTWGPRTLGISGASAEVIALYIRELETRSSELAAAQDKARRKAFREKVQKAVRDAKDRLITGWVGEESSPHIRRLDGQGPAPCAASAGRRRLCGRVGPALEAPGGPLER